MPAVKIHSAGREVRQLARGGRSRFDLPHGKFFILVVRKGKPFSYLSLAIALLHADSVRKLVYKAIFYDYHVPVSPPDVRSCLLQFKEFSNGLRVLVLHIAILCLNCFCNSLTIAALT